MAGSSSLKRQTLSLYKKILQKCARASNHQRSSSRSRSKA
ncbi:Uncharacterized protein APZ42_020474 [Daphnia magna]|uniref:Uncharacterized protein n=1 Tax=Daphnia magna TaxID=35525 RepID=A0A164XHH3_9CRUS|nr:Uncharacterized protein APZ42_020474 [Daphnia magna]